MKICYLANTAIPSSNASAIQIVKMCETFSKLKHEVLLITTNASEKNFFYDYDVKFKFGVKKLKNFNKFPIGFRYYLFSIYSIFESLIFKPDIYITRNFFTCFLLTILKKKTILEIHHDLNIESRIVNFLVKKFNYLNNKNLIKIIAITENVKLEYKKKYNIDQNKIIVLPSGSSISQKFSPPKNKKRLNIGYLGSLYKSRGFYLIQKLAKIDRKNKYYIYGNLKDQKNLYSTNYNNNFYINNYISYRKIPKILNDMDILLMPYVSSVTVAGDVGNITKFTSPLKLFDYLSVGRVIMCSNLDVLKECLNENINAIFIKNFTNAYAWKMEIQKIANQKIKFMIMSKNNHEHSKKFNHDKRAKKIIDIIK